MTETPTAPPAPALPATPPAAVAATPTARPALRAPSPGGRYSWQRPPPRTAGLRRRLLAFALDLVVVFCLAWALTFIVAAAGILRVPDIIILEERSEIAGLLYIVSIFELPITLLYFTLLETLGGRTLGKMLVGLRVQRVDGAPTNLFDAFLRNLLRLLWVTPFGPAFALLDLWSLRATELDQRLGDFAADTIVVDERLAV